MTISSSQEAKLYMASCNSLQGCPFQLFLRFLFVFGPDLTSRSCEFFFGYESGIRGRWVVKGLHRSRNPAYVLSLNSSPSITPSGHFAALGMTFLFFGGSLIRRFCMKGSPCDDRRGLDVGFASMRDLSKRSFLSALVGCTSGPGWLRARPCEMLRTVGVYVKSPNETNKHQVPREKKPSWLNMSSSGPSF